MLLKTEHRRNILEKDILDHLKSLHTSEIDARNGYEKALEDAEGAGMRALFRAMIRAPRADDNAHELVRRTGAGQRTNRMRMAPS